MKCLASVPTGSDELCTFKIRYKEPLEDWLKEMVPGGKNKNLTERDAERLTWFVEAMLLNLQ